eukprot:c9302_g1_i1.p1 GENE.c9302_g1_i1~~c9302_g1_i1.p1  ORF type:complete len:114 (-),score=15.95 c9302_g1_i1:160-501(-)
MDHGNLFLISLNRSWFVSRTLALKPLHSTKYFHVRLQSVTAISHNRLFETRICNPNEQGVAKKAKVDDDAAGPLPQLVAVVVAAEQQPKHKFVVEGRGCRRSCEAAIEKKRSC